MEPHVKAMASTRGFTIDVSYRLFLRSSRVVPTPIHGVTGPVALSVAEISPEAKDPWGTIRFAGSAWAKSIESGYFSKPFSKECPAMLLV